MVRCKNCKFSEESSKDQLRCTLAKSEDGYAKHAESLAVAQDYESYQAWLYVQPTFGCVQGVKK